MCCATQKHCNPPSCEWQIAKWMCHTTDKPLFFLAAPTTTGQQNVRRSQQQQQRPNKEPPLRGDISTSNTTSTLGQMAESQAELMLQDSDFPKNYVDMAHLDDYTATVTQLQPQLIEHPSRNFGAPSTVTWGIFQIGQLAGSLHSPLV